MLEGVLCQQPLAPGLDQQAAAYLDDHYQRGQGIRAGFGDLTGIFCHARIPIRETLHEGNGPIWLAEKARPDLLHTEHMGYRSK